MQEIKAYADFQQMTDSEDREDLLHYVQFLDQLFVKHIDSKTPKGGKPQGK